MSQPIVRIVHMRIHQEHIQRMEDRLTETLPIVRSVEGCLEANFYRGEETGSYFTVSRWESEERLHAYRRSDLFGTIWPSVKQWFCEKPEAHTLYPL